MTAEGARIAIYGAGAMGTVLGALLTKGGLVNVHLFTRNAEHVRGLNEKGATIVCTATGRELTVPVKAFTPDWMTEKYDVIFLMTKQRQNAEILQFLLPYLQENGVVCTTQNGLPEDSVAAVVGEERTYGCVATYGANFIGGGKVELTSSPEAMRMQVSGYRKGNAKSGLIKDILSYAGKAIENEAFASETDNLAGARWSKLAINAAFSGLSVITGLSFGEIAKKNKTRKIALGILRECIAVAKASGVTLEKTQGHDIEKMLGGNTPWKRFIAYMVLPFAMKKHKKLHSGMLRDMREGKRCEIDFINGAVCRAGERVGAETPLCKQIVEITHGIENGLYEIDYKNVDFFEL